MANEIKPDEPKPSEPASKCQNCTRNPGTAELHTCPFAEEIHGDDTTLCNCCDDCSHQCAMDI